MTIQMYSVAGPGTARTAPLAWKTLLLDFAQKFPDAQRFGCAPRLRIAASRGVRHVTVQNFWNVAGASGMHQIAHAQETGARSGHCARLEIPGTCHRFTP